MTAPQSEPMDEPTGTTLAHASPHAAMLAQREYMRTVQREIRNKSWGKDLPERTLKSVVLWCEKRGLDAATEVDILGGNIYIKADYYLRRLAQMIGDDRVEYAYPDHVHEDPRLLELASNTKAPADIRENATREYYRRAMERSKYNLSDRATAAVVYRVKVKGMTEEVVGAKQCGGGVRKGDPVGDDRPVETAETRAARRACRQVIDKFPDLKAEMDIVESEAQLLSVQVHAVRAEAAIEAARPRRGIPHVASGSYEAPEIRQIEPGKVETKVINEMPPVKRHAIDDSDQGYTDEELGL